MAGVSEGNVSESRRSALAAAGGGHDESVRVSIVSGSPGGRLARRGILIGGLGLIAIGLERLANAYMLQEVMDVQVRVVVGMACVVTGGFMLGVAAVMRPP